MTKTIMTITKTKRVILFSGIIFIVSIMYNFCYADSTLINEYLPSPATGSTTTKYGSLASNTYTSKIQNTESVTRMRGMIITDGTAAPTSCYTNWSAGGTSTTVWHGTDTVVFVQTGNIWRGEIDFPIFGRFTKATIGGFGNATFLSINWYTTSSPGRDIATKWLDVVAVLGTTTVQLAPQSSSRKYILIVNEGTTNDLYISGNTPIATSTAGILIAKNNGYWEESTGKFYDAIYAIASAGTTSVRITELK